MRHATMEKEDAMTEPAAIAPRVRDPHNADRLDADDRAEFAQVAADGRRAAEEFERAQEAMRRADVALTEARGAFNHVTGRIARRYGLTDRDALMDDGTIRRAGAQEAG